MTCSLCGNAPVLFAELTDCPKCQLRATPREVLEAGIARQAAAAAALEASRVTVAIVGCGQAKRPGTHKARDLYTSNLFRASVRWAEAHAAHVHVASAKHLLVDLDQELEAYEARLPSSGARFCSAEPARASWGRALVAELERRYPGVPLHLVILAGADYAGPIASAVPTTWTVEQPLSGLDLFERMRWLAREAA